MTNGRGDDREVSWDEVPRKVEVRVDCATTVRRMERGGMVDVGTMGGGGTRACMRGGRLFSFPPSRTLSVNANFFHVSVGRPSLSLGGEPLCTRKKLLVKVKAVFVEAASDAGRLDLDGYRAGGTTAVTAAGSRPRSCLISVDASGACVRYCTLTSTSPGLGGLPVLVKDRDDASSLCRFPGVGRDDEDDDDDKVASPADHGGILDACDPARRGPNSGGVRL